MKMPAQSVLCALFASAFAVVAGAAQRFVVAPSECANRAMVFRSSFTCPDGLRASSLEMVGLGVFEFAVNGREVESSALKPGYTMCDVRQRYVFDVAKLLRPGENQLTVEVADSYWRDVQAGNRDRKPNGFSARLVVTTDRGEEVVLSDDGDWEVTTDGPLVRASIYGGETYDARLQDFSHATWRKAAVTNLSVRVVSERGAVHVRSDLVRRAETPFAVRPGERKVVDFAQNCAGRESFAVRGSRGACVTVRHAEVLNPDGSCYFDNLRGAAATTHYTLRGGETERYRPRFTYYGFRYAEISVTEPVVFESFELEPLTSVAEALETGSITTSDADINRVISSAEWSLRSNQLSVPTDCAQRDERQSWIGDACLSVPATCWLWDARDFYAKSARDQRDAQRGDGCYSAIAPGNRGWMKPQWYGTVGWGDSGILIPYLVWRHFGDLSGLREHYASMCEYSGWLIRSGGPVASGFGDWLSFARTGFGDPAYPYASDPATFEFLAAAYRIRDFEALGEMAEALGKAEDAGRCRQEAEASSAALKGRFFDTRGRLKAEYASQTTLAVALAFGLCPDETSRKRTVEALVTAVKHAGGRLMTGIVGTAFIMNALSDNGQARVAYDLLLNRACPSWLYMTDRGATTLWEHWDGILSDGRFNTPSMNSFNHAEYASVLDWMYRTMAGIRPDPKKGGFGSIVLKPQPDRRIRTVEAKYRTARGEIAVRSHFAEDGSWTYDYGLPDGTTATLSLPGRAPVAVSGRGSVRIPAQDPVR